ncbi:MAG: glycosyltransferase family 4 protein [Prolixibacteraceae bacterium]|nr:glycosyltransferase family 4 protein [Prolixibacteraceae bacterium]
MPFSENRILVVVPFAFHRESGSSLSTFYRVSALADLCSRIDVITTPHGRSVDIVNVSIRRFPSIKLFRNYEPGQYFKKLMYEPFLFFGTLYWLIIRRFDVVIVHGSSIYWAFLIHKLFKARFIATVHGNIETELDKWGISKSRMIKRISAKIENKILDSFSFIIAEHDEVKNILVRGNVEPNKIKVIRICVKNVDRFVKMNYDDWFIVLYTGTFVKVQNLDLLYRTASLLKNEKIRFILIGGTSHEIETEKIKVERYGVSEIVTLLPRMQQKYLESYYRNADIVVSPRVFGHDTPMKIFDYLNYGKCIVATNKPIHSGILNNNVSHLVEPKPECFAEKIRELFFNYDLILRTSIKAKDFFVENFDFKIMVKAYKEVLHHYSE